MHEFGLTELCVIFATIMGAKMPPMLMHKLSMLIKVPASKNSLVIDIIAQCCHASISLKYPGLCLKEAIKMEILA